SAPPLSRSPVRSSPSIPARCARTTGRASTSRSCAGRSGRSTRWFSKPRSGTTRGTAMAELTLADGAKLYYEVHGDGPPLVLVAGLSGSATFWNAHLPELSKRYKLVLHDHRGTGRSSLDRIEYSVPQMADDVLAL